jgi:hypothetical protein
MSHLKLTIAMKNAAFDQCPQLEVARILRDDALREDDGITSKLPCVIQTATRSAAALSVRLWVSKLMNFLNCGGARTYEDRTTTYWMLRNKHFGKIVYPAAKGRSTKLWPHIHHQ